MLSPSFRPKASTMTLGMYIAYFFPMRDLIVRLKCYSPDIFEIIRIIKLFSIQKLFFCERYDVESGISKFKSEKIEMLDKYRICCLLWGISREYLMWRTGGLSKFFPIIQMRR